eukprot:TRINITY_DN79163_c0_g1_i1.p1 TRINITY_DN79163_c0_g1~~TRINITY_DN79163_c0_g1_i1.p1  ORF type:complete len:337 (+),score=51.61 TRINITY_DN79163_c0_g1_i1:85-1095(+)
MLRGRRNIYRALGLIVVYVGGCCFSPLWAVDAQENCAASRMIRKAIKQVLPAAPKHWVGDGFHVHPVFSNKAFSAELSPFLMFDYAAPKYFGPSTERRGVGQHPHRGFETVTIAFSGEIEHADSTGQRDIIRAGDVQWMTAGRGIIHEEFMSTEFSKTGGDLEMCQLWLNLPHKHKMVKPGYQAITAGQIPNVPLSSGDLADGHVRVIAGDYNSTSGVASTFTPVNLWDIVMRAPSRPYTFDIPAGHNTVLFVRRGSIEVSDGDGSNQQLGGQQVAILEQPGTLLEITALEADTSVLLLGGEPIDEPIAAQGPFVMNTQAELQQAMHDFRSGRMGQ